MFLSTPKTELNTPSYNMGKTINIPTIKGALSLPNHIRANTTKTIVGIDVDKAFTGFSMFLNKLLPEETIPKNIELIKANKKLTIVL